MILLLAVPIRIQFYFNTELAYVLNRRARVGLVRGRFFELAVATALALFGCQSGEALPTVLGALKELVRFPWLTRDRAAYLTERHSERVAATVLPEEL